jgi:hypothetical protein
MHKGHSRKLPSGDDENGRNFLVGHSPSKGEGVEEARARFAFMATSFAFVPFSCSPEKSNGHTLPVFHRRCSSSPSQIPIAGAYSMVYTFFRGGDKRSRRTSKMLSWVQRIRSGPSRSPSEYIPRHLLLRRRPSTARTIIKGSGYHA